MKIKRFLAVLVVLCLFLTGCSSSFSWDKSVAKLEDAGYEVTKNYITEEDLNKITQEINTEFKMHKKEHIVEVVRYMSLDKEDSLCFFVQFKEEEQAKNYYDLRLSYRLDVDGLNLALYEDVLLITNSLEVVDLLKLNFN